MVICQTQITVCIDNAKKTQSSNQQKLDLSIKEYFKRIESFFLAFSFHKQISLSFPQEQEKLCFLKAFGTACSIIGKHDHDSVLGG